jgi:hypothetical protein
LIERVKGIWPTFMFSIKESRVWSCKVVKTCFLYTSVWRKGSNEYDEHRSSGPRPVNIFSFCLELYKNKCRNLIRTSKFKCSFRGLDQLWYRMPHSFQVLTRISWMILQIISDVQSFSRVPCLKLFWFSVWGHGIYINMH